MRSTLSIFIALFILSSCNSLEFSPDQTFNKNSPRDLNAQNVARIQSTAAKDDTLRFIVTGDTQRSHDEVKTMISKINSLEAIEFVAIAGDLSEFGVLKEMEWIADSFKKLTVPYVAIVGNHDLVAKGNEVFERMYGPLNYSFTYRGIKFVCHDTNSREYHFDGSTPNISWLRQELQQQANVTGFVTISHVPPNSLDFEQKLIVPYSSLFGTTQGFLASFHGHTHTYSQFGYEGSRVPYIITASNANKEFLLVKIINNKLSYERIFF
ncbi:MAG: metallophosphoesterase [Pedobacter sp.]|nr:MAG: metallophosphoesterase [Pedobacter sp.]